MQRQVLHFPRGGGLVEQGRVTRAEDLAGRGYRLGFLASVPMERIRRCFARTSAATVSEVLTWFWFQAVMAALRWRWILCQLVYPLTTGASVEAWLVGQCANQILPAVVSGYAARIIQLRRYHASTAAALVLRASSRSWCFRRSPDIVDCLQGQGHSRRNFLGCRVELPGSRSPVTEPAIGQPAHPVFRRIPRLSASRRS